MIKFFKKNIGFISVDVARVNFIGNINFVDIKQKIILFQSQIRMGGIKRKKSI